eukprot:GHVS01011657.1.p1 GENE.GHVS01011657.1~~GHVS01011657.1.p1  ORF type:complete len:1105 (+),score=251.61 GHVS01011657.1:189-3503(+)
MGLTPPPYSCPPSSPLHFPPHAAVVELLVQANRPSHAVRTSAPSCRFCSENYTTTHLDQQSAASGSSSWLRVQLQVTDRGVVCDQNVIAFKEIQSVERKATTMGDGQSVVGVSAQRVEGDVTVGGGVQQDGVASGDALSSCRSEDRTIWWCVHIVAVNNSYWVLRCSDKNTEALQLLDIATTTARFIGSMRPLCKLLRHDAEKRLKAVNVFKELTHRHRMERNNKEQESHQIECDTIKAIATRHHGIDLDAPYMRSGLELEDLAVLEDAIVYFPITCAYYFKSVLFLRELPSAGYRRREQLLEVCQNVHSVFAAREAQQGVSGGSLLVTTSTTGMCVTKTAAGVSKASTTDNNNTTTQQQLTSSSCSIFGSVGCGVDGNSKTTTVKQQQSIVVVNNNSDTTYSTTTTSSSLSAATAVVAESIAPCVWAVQSGYCVIGKGVGNTCDDAVVCMGRLGCIAVFDGVGSWTHRNIDPSVFSNAMADDSHVYLQQMMPSTSHCYINAGNCSFSDETCCTKLGFDSLGIDGPKVSVVSQQSVMGQTVEVVNHRQRTHRRTKEIMFEAHHSVKRNKLEAWGSSTAVVGVVNRLTGQLGVSCLGDSAIMVFRRKIVGGGGGEGLLMGRMREVVFQTDEQRWPNEAPFQLSHLPDSSKWNDLRDRGMDMFVDTLEQADLNGDSARDANDSKLDLEPGDLVLAMSDGVSDNLFAKEIAVLVSLAISPEEANIMGYPERATTAMTVARGVSEAAKTRSEDPVGYHGVFQKDKSADVTNRRRRAKLDVAGAKPDDISVVACWVTCEDTESLKSIIAERRQDNSQSGVAVRTVPTSSCPVSDACLPVSLFPKLLEAEKAKSVDAGEVCVLTEVLRRLPPTFSHLQQQQTTANCQTTTTVEACNNNNPTATTTPTTGSSSTTAVTTTQPKTTSPSRIPSATTTPLPRQRPPLVKVPTPTRKGVGLTNAAVRNITTPVRPLKGVSSSSRLCNNGGVRTPVVARGAAGRHFGVCGGGSMKNGAVVDGSHDVVMGGGVGVDDVFYDSGVVVANELLSPIKRAPMLAPTPTPLGVGLRRNPARKGRPACPIRVSSRGIVVAPPSEPNTPAVSDDETVAVDSR